MIRVLIIDDSVVFRKILSEALNREREISVVGCAVNGKEAIQKMASLRPDMAVLDVEMPEMNGLETLDAMRKRGIKTGVIMFSTLTEQGAETTMQALERGAFDFVPKPTGTGAFSKSVERIKTELIPKIKAFAASRNGSGPMSRALPKKRVAGPQKDRPGAAARAGRERIGGRAQQSTAGMKPARPPRSVPALSLKLKPEAVGIGVSTGGPKALNHVIPQIPANFRLPVFLVQHMPPVFTSQLAKRLNQSSKLKVVEAEDGMIVKPATVYIAPGDYHMTVVSKNGLRVIDLNHDPPENSCRPAVDVLFRSLAKVYGGRVVAVIMTGMGKDGLRGAEELKRLGARIIAQDKASSTVYGMPKAVADAGISDRICPLEKIPGTILEFCGHRF